MKLQCLVNTLINLILLWGNKANQHQNELVRANNSICSCFFRLQNNFSFLKIYTASRHCHNLHSSPHTASCMSRCFPSNTLPSLRSGPLLKMYRRGKETWEFILKWLGVFGTYVQVIVLKKTG